MTYIFNPSQLASLDVGQVIQDAATLTEFTPNPQHDLANAAGTGADTIVAGNDLLASGAEVDSIAGGAAANSINVGDDTTSLASTESTAGGHGDQIVPAISGTYDFSASTISTLEAHTNSDTLAMAASHWQDFDISHLTANPADMDAPTATNEPIQDAGAVDASTAGSGDVATLTDSDLTMILGEVSGTIDIPGSTGPSYETIYGDATGYYTGDYTHCWGRGYFTGADLDGVLTSAGTINFGDDGYDWLTLDSTSAALNDLGAVDASIQGVYAIYFDGEAGVTLNLAGQTEGFTIWGTSFDDTITGGSGFDWLHGGASNDALTGGVGGDYFLFDTALDGATNVDRIVDFAPSEDFIQLDRAVFTALPESSNADLAEGAFYNGAAAHDADDRIIYNPATGALSYDADGNGAGEAVQFATLGTGLTLHAGYFVVSGAGDASTVATGEVVTPAASELDTILCGTEVTIDIVGSPGPSDGTWFYDDATGSYVMGSSGGVYTTGAELDGLLTSTGTIDFGGGYNDIVLTSTSAALNHLGADDASIQGIDTITLAGEAGETVNLFGQTESFTIVGSNFDDAITGGSGSNWLYGGSGNDTITGGESGFNYLVGEAGNDTICGGAGGDHFVFDTALDGANNVDRIVDFTPSDDEFQLDHTVFTTQSEATDLADGALYSGAAAHDPDDRIIYNPATGALSYDADGNGAGKAVQFATLDTGLTLHAGNFFVI